MASKLREVTVSILFCPNKHICLTSAIRFRSVPWMQDPLGLLGPDAAILPQSSLVSPVEYFLSLVLLAGSSGAAGSQQAQRAHWHRAAAARAKAAAFGKVSATTRWGRFCFCSSWRPCRRVFPELPRAGGGHCWCPSIEGTSGVIRETCFQRKDSPRCPLLEEMGIRLPISKMWC